MANKIVIKGDSLEVTAEPIVSMFKTDEYVLDIKANIGRLQEQINARQRRIDALTTELTDLQNAGIDIAAPT